MVRKEDQGVPAPSSPSGCQPSASAVPASQSGIPNAGDYVIFRGWGISVRQIEKVTPKLIKLRRGGFPHQLRLDDTALIAFVSDHDIALRLRDSIAGADGEFHRRRHTADAERAARVEAAREARDKTVARLIREVSEA